MADSSIDYYRGLSCPIISREQPTNSQRDMRLERKVLLGRHRRLTGTQQRDADLSIAATVREGIYEGILRKRFHAAPIKSSVFYTPLPLPGPPLADRD